MTPQLTSFVAAARANELSHAVKHARPLAAKPTEHRSATRRGWFWRPRLARLWQQECAEH
jgi:hypothetical protein